MTSFRIDATDLHWLEGCEKTDLCLHGNARAVIGERTLEYEDCTVSSTALYLLKSLTEDHIINQDNQMLPCCGHFMISADDGENVIVCGCPNGIDWTVRHTGDGVELILEDGYTVTVPMGDYRREVLAFVQKIEDFYNTAEPRELSGEQWERDVYGLFWKEWHRRKEGADMTPDKALYHLTMLKLGEYEEYDRELDRLLEEQEPLSPLVLELACCMSDRRETISVLHNFLLDHPADPKILYDTQLKWLRQQFEAKAMTALQAAEYMSKLIAANNWEDPWDELGTYLYEYELYDGGYISQEVFEKCFDSHFFHGIRLDPWQLQGEENARKSLWGKIKDLLKS